MDTASDALAAVEQKMALVVAAMERDFQKIRVGLHRELELLQRSCDRFVAEIDRFGRAKEATILRV